MSCDCDSTDFCWSCGDTVQVKIEQCGSVWPTSATRVFMKISCNGCGGTSFEVDATSYDLAAPGTATFDIGPEVTASLTKGARMCDYKIVAVSAAGARFTFQRGRISVK